MKYLKIAHLEFNEVNTQHLVHIMARHYGKVLTVEQASEMYSILGHPEIKFEENHRFDRMMVHFEKIPVLSLTNDYTTIEFNLINSSEDWLYKTYTNEDKVSKLVKEFESKIREDISQFCISKQDELSDEEYKQLWDELSKYFYK